MRSQLKKLKTLNSKRARVHCAHAVFARFATQNLPNVLLTLLEHDAFCLQNAIDFTMLWSNFCSSSEINVIFSDKIHQDLVKLKVHLVNLIVYTDLSNNFSVYTFTKLIFITTVFRPWGQFNVEKYETNKMGDGERL